MYFFFKKDTLSILRHTIYHLKYGIPFFCKKRRKKTTIPATFGNPSGPRFSWHDEMTLDLSLVGQTPDDSSPQTRK